MDLYKFAVESNEIEGIHCERQHLNHAAALEKFLALPKLSVDAVCEFVKSIEPDSRLRTGHMGRVWIGGREAPSFEVVHERLPILIDAVNGGSWGPGYLHKEYEWLHPFIDGNGRSGRAIWLWQKVKFEKYNGQYGFLQMYYYDTLSTGVTQ